MANTLGSLVVILEAQTAAFARGMGDAKSLAFSTSGEIVESLKRVGEQLGKLKFDSAGEFKKSAGIAAGVIAGIGVAVAASSLIVAKEVAAQVKEMAELAQSYGLSVEMVSQLRVASALTGVSMEELSKGMGRLAKAAATAAEGGKTQAAAFATLGITVADNSGHLRPMNELLTSVADGFSKMENSTGKTALAMQLFGRSGAALIPFFNKGAEGIREYQELSDKLGLTWSGEDTEGAETFKGALALVGLETTGLKESLVKGMLPALDQMASAFLTVDADGKPLIRTIGEGIGGAVKLAIGAIYQLITWWRQALVVLDLRKWGKDAEDEFNSLDRKFVEFTNKLYAAPDNKLLKTLAGSQVGAANPTFHNLGTAKPDSGLSQLLNQAREIFNKAEGSTIETQISNIEHLKTLLEQFAASHPDHIFLDINAAVEKLNITEGELIAKAHGAIQSELSNALRNQIGNVLGAATSVPSASGQVQTESQLIDLYDDEAQQNRERLDIYRQTSTVMERYSEQIRRLSILYTDHSSQEYLTALGRINAALKEQLAQEAIERLYTNPKTGLAGAGQGISAGAQSIAATWKGIPAETGQATIQTLGRMQGAFSSFFATVGTGTKSIGQAFAQLGRDMLGSIVEALAQMLAKWLTTHLLMAVISKIFGKANAVAESITGATTNAALATSAAFLGAANAYAFWAWNPPVAAAVAGTALGVGLGFAGSSLAAGLSGSVASAAGGMEVDRDQLAFIHKDEKVLPARISQGFTDIINGFRTPSQGRGHLAFAGGGGNTFGGHTFNFSINGATDSKAVGDEVMGRVQRFFKSGGVMK